MARPNSKLPDGDSAQRESPQAPAQPARGDAEGRALAIVLGCAVALAAAMLAWCALRMLFG